MKRLIFALLLIALSSGFIVATHGQVVPSATERVFTVRAGGLFSAFQPDYVGGGATLHSQWLYSAGAYSDIRASRWVQPEIEVRWGRFNEYNPCPTCSGSQGIDENTYSAGLRVPIKDFRRFTPYGKFLVGFGNGSFLDGDALVFTYGGGVDYGLTRRFTIRACDFEYQQWSVTNLTLRPYGFSAGLSYRVFSRGRY